jgi:tape measure domain-containing protein
VADLRLGIVISAVDRATATVRRVKESVSRAGAPAAALGKSLAGYGSAIGITRVASAAAKVGPSLSTAAGEAGKLALQLGAIGGVAGWLFKTQFIDVAAQFEAYGLQLEAIEGSSEGAKRSMSWVENFATKTPAQLGGVMDAFVRMRNFGLDPMDGSMQAIVDQTAKLGFDQEKLMGIVMAVGQAWGKGKLQGEEILQLIERGVPVWDLLAKATGKSVPELQKISSQGGLTQKAIKLLLAEMGKQAAGSAEAQMKSWPGMISNLQDAWTQFAEAVMQAGLFDWMKARLSGLLETVNRLSESGQLQVWAKQVGDAIREGFEKVWAAKDQVFAAAMDIADAFMWVKDKVGGLRNMLLILAGLMAAKTVAATVQLGVSLGQLGASIIKTTASVIASVVPWQALNFQLFTLRYHLMVSVVPALKTFGVRMLAAAAPLWAGVTAVGAYIASLVSMSAVMVRRAIVAIGGYIVAMGGAAVATLAAAWPILAIIAAIGLLAAGVYAVYRNWGRISAWFKEHWKGIAVGLAIVFPPIIALGAAAALVYKYWEPIKEFFGELWEGVKQIFDASVSWIMDKIQPLIDATAGVASTVGGWFSSDAAETPAQPPGPSGPGDTEQAPAQLPNRGGLPYGAARQTLGGDVLQIRVGGVLKVQIDSENRPRVKELKSEGGMDIDVDTGLAWAAP